MIITAVISIALYLIDKGEHTALYKINNNVYLKTSKIIYKHNTVILQHHIRTRGDKSQHRKVTLEKKFLAASAGIEPSTFPS